MPIPIINDRTSVLVGEVGIALAYQPLATESPTGWAATNLPAGLAVNAATGLVDGSPTVAGVYNFELVATNGSGDSLPLVLTMGVSVSDLVDPNDLSVPLDWNIESGLVTLAGADDGRKNGAVYEVEDAGGEVIEMLALLSSKSGDKRPYAIRLIKGGAGQVMTLGALRYGIKEFESEGLVALNDGSWVAVGSGAETRYKILLDFDRSKLAGLLSNYEDDAGTVFFPLGEFELTVQDYSSAAYPVAALITSLGSVSDGALENDTFNIVDLPKTNGTYTVNIALKMPGKTAQEVALVREVTVSWDGTIFSADSVTGAASGQGENELGHWRTTLSDQGITGTAVGLDVATRVVTSSGYGWRIVVDLAGSATSIVSGVLSNGGADAAEVDSVTPASFDFSNGDTEANVENAIEAALSDVTEVDGVAFDEVNQLIIVSLPDGAGLADQINLLSATVPISSRAQVTQAASVEVQATTEPVTLRLSSQTHRHRLERDLIDI